MRDRILIALVACFGLGGCLKLLGDYDLAGTDPGGTAGGSSTTSGGTTTSNPGIPCWKRAADGWCVCASAAPTAEYTASATCEANNSGAAAGKCCGFDGWPAIGNCTCGTFRCLVLKENSNSCVCGAYASPEATSDFEETYYCSAASGETCCKAPGRCHCGNECDADAGEAVAESCTPSDFADSVPCGDGGVVLTSCR